jgi:hypothetical protein
MVASRAQNLRRSGPAPRAAKHPAVLPKRKTGRAPPGALTRIAKRGKGGARIVTAAPFPTEHGTGQGRELDERRAAEAEIESPTNRRAGKGPTLCGD